MNIMNEMTCVFKMDCTSVTFRLKLKPASFSIISYQNTNFRTNKSKTLLYHGNALLGTFNWRNPLRKSKSGGFANIFGKMAQL